MPQIICENVSLGYDGKAVTEGLNLNINAGEYWCVVGENGVGKSTFIKTLLGLIAPVSGEIKFSDGLKSTEIGYLPQQTAVQRDFPASVREIVLSGCLGGMGRRPFYSAQQKSLAEKNMEKLGISDLARRCYRELSGGQQQRVLLARALCATKSLLLLDEPVAGLDPVGTREMYELTKTLNDEGITVIMVSHDIASAVKYASHILHMGEKPLFVGTKDDYIKSSVGRFFTGTEDDINE